MKPHDESDFIEISGLAVRAIIGVYPDERTRRQELLLGFRLYADLRPAGQSDAIADAVDYREVTKRVLAFVESSRFELLEALAERVAQLLLQNARVNKVKLTIQKPGALRHARTVGVTIVRARDGRE
ncbi:MAG: dihydroneopterin aldolase [Planctomycetota bacterium]